jgi:hypothetical protein
MATETEAQTEHAELHDVIRESMDRLHVPGLPSASWLMARTMWRPSASPT